MKGTPKSPLEHTEQVRVVEWMKHFHPGVIVAAVPNGGRRTKTEAGRLKAEGVLPGYPDLLIDEPRGGYHGLRIEMKRVGGKGATVAQKAVHARLRAAGYRVETCHGAAEATGLIDAYLRQPAPAVDPLR